VSFQAFNYRLLCCRHFCSLSELGAIRPDQRFSKGRAHAVAAAADLDILGEGPEVPVIAVFPPITVDDVVGRKALSVEQLARREHAQPMSVMT
jgi:hypothetical protein